MYTVHFVGLIYFHVCHSGEKVALLPDGTNAVGTLPEHYASLFVSGDDLDSDDWWSGERLEHDLPVVDDQGEEQDMRVVEFRIPAYAEVTFSGAEDSGLDMTNLKQALPKLKEIDSKFEVDASDVDAIARVALAGGGLATYKFNDVAAVQWTVAQTSAPIVITATTQSDSKTITLRDAGGSRGTEIVMGNTPDLIGEHSQHHMGDHFKLYGKLNKTRDGDGLKAPGGPPSNLNTLPFGHPYLAFLYGKNEIPEPGCTPTCC